MRNHRPRAAFGGRTLDDPMQQVLSDLREMSATLVLDLQEIKATLAVLMTEKIIAKDMYTVQEAAAILHRSAYTVREYMRKRQAGGVKARNGRTWLLPRDELLRLQNEGPIP